MKILLFALWPLLLTNVILWEMYAHNHFMAGIWGLLIVTSPYLLPDGDRWRWGR